MKYLLILVILFISAGLIYFGVFTKEQPQSNNSQQTKPMDIPAQIAWETKVDEQSPVTIKVTPLLLRKDSEKWKFQIVFDTHSGSLDDDLLSVISLIDDKGVSYQPISWDGPGPGGHHRDGVLVFNAIDPIPLAVELKFKNIGAVAERAFKWELK